LFLCSLFDIIPIVQKQDNETSICCPEDNLIDAFPPSFFISLPEQPADLAICPPLPGFNSILFIRVPIGTFLSIKELPILMGVFGLLVFIIVSSFFNPSEVNKYLSDPSEKTTNEM
jgi:hypothetical protein